MPKNPKLPDVIWVVLEKSFHYNDEIHYFQDDTDGTPRNFFSDRKTAEAEAERQNLRFVQKALLNLGEYCYTLADIIPLHIIEKYELQMGEDNNLESNKGPIADDTLALIANELNIKPYSVFELRQK